MQYNVTWFAVTRNISILFKKWIGSLCQVGLPPTKDFSSQQVARLYLGVLFRTQGQALKLAAKHRLK